ncbi:MAG: TolC family protein [Bryobacterales bacterium]|nr:TolC family protein [Acidobacteriota bacterium]MCB9385424.1 TolC family protein [Bryobacterales bacterium]
MTVKQFLSLLLVATLLHPSFAAAQEFRRAPVDYSHGPDTWPKLWTAYDVPDVPEIDLANSGRLDQLLRAGKLYLSLKDALALAIENNLDIAAARYDPLVSQTDVLRAKSGQQLRGVQTQISTLSTGQSQGGGTGARGSNATGVTGRAGTTTTGGGTSSGDASSFFGTQAVALDPRLFASIDWGHFSNPQTSDFVTGTNSLITERSNSQIGVRQGFLSGATATLLWANTQQNTNSLRNNFNPSLRSNVTLQVSQPLLRGFGLAVNRRNIVVAKRNQQVTDLAFKQQVITVVVRVQQLYWDLVSLRSNVDAARQALDLAGKLYDDNKRRVEIGTLAPIEIVRAEAEAAARQEDLTIAETQLKLQETLIKNAISINGVASPSLIHAEIIPTDRIEVPRDEVLPPVEEMMQTALAERPDIEQAQIRLGNTDINLKAIRNARLPQVNVSFDVTNNGLAGQVNDLFVGAGVPTDFFLGGLGNSLGQIFRRNFPDYQVTLDVNIPLRNRQAQADLTATMLEQRKSQIQLRQTENSIRVEVQNAVIGLQQAKARYEAARKGLTLQEQTLDAEQKKFDLGASTIFLVVQAQRDVAVARSQEIAAMNNYAIAKIGLENALGRTLEANGITLAEALDGTVGRAADPIPVTP